MDYFHQINHFLETSSFFYTIAIGMDSRYTYVSKNYDRNFDRSGTSLLGKEFSVTLHPDDLQICEQAGQSCFEQPGQLVPATLRKHDGRGGFVFTQWEMKAFFDENGIPAGIFCVGYNISEFIDTRSKLDDATTEIEEKNNQLTEIGFMQSHLVRKPLANIMGLTDMMEEMHLEDDARQINHMIMESAQELDTVIKDITNRSELG